MEMFKVKALRPDGSVLQHFFEGVEFARVRFPDELFPLLRKGDVFLLTMGLKDNTWEMIDIIGPYH